MKNKIYCDFNATCPLAEEVVQTISNALTSSWANPSSKSEQGKLVKEQIEEAGSLIAAMINANSSEIIFMSGGTEANNLVISSALEYFRSQNLLDKNLLPHVITSSIEHDSIKLPLQILSHRKLIDLTVVSVDKSSGQVIVADVMRYLRPNTCLVTVMLANNETGVVQPIEAIGQRLKEINEHRDRTLEVLFHTDTAQAIGKMPVNVKKLAVDYLTIVGHKFYGPRNGALYARKIKDKDRLLLYPNLFGGGQERGYRPGTENTPMILGLGKAASLVSEKLNQYAARMEEIRNYFESELKKTFGGKVKINFQQISRLPNTSSVLFPNMKMSAATLLESCETFAASTGAACHVNTKASAILLACGLDVEHARRTVRFSFGRETTKLQIDTVIEELKFKITEEPKGTPVKRAFDIDVPEKRLCL